MARRPFFSGNYGSALGSYDTAARLLAGAGQAQGQMFANLGADIGGAIQKYQLNKEKRAVLTGEIEAALPQFLNDLTMTGDEDEDKKNMSRIEKFKGNDMNMSDLKGFAGELARMEKRRATKLQSDYMRARTADLVSAADARRAKTDFINLTSAEFDDASPSSAAPPASAPPTPSITAQQLAAPAPSAPAPSTSGAFPLDTRPAAAIDPVQDRSNQAIFRGHSGAFHTPDTPSAPPELTGEPAPPTQTIDDTLGEVDEMIETFTDDVTGEKVSGIVGEAITPEEAKDIPELSDFFEERIGDRALEAEGPEQEFPETRAPDALPADAESLDHVERQRTIDAVLDQSPARPSPRPSIRSEADFVSQVPEVDGVRVDTGLPEPRGAVRETLSQILDQAPARQRRYRGIQERPDPSSPINRPGNVLINGIPVPASVANTPPFRGPAPDTDTGLPEPEPLIQRLLRESSQRRHGPAPRSAPTTPVFPPGTGPTPRGMQGAQGQPGPRGGVIGPHGTQVHLPSPKTSVVPTRVPRRSGIPRGVADMSQRELDFMRKFEAMPLGKQAMMIELMPGYVKRYEDLRKKADGWSKTAIGNPRRWLDENGKDTGKYIVPLANGQIQIIDRPKKPEKPEYRTFEDAEAAARVGEKPVKVLGGYNIERAVKKGFTPIPNSRFFQGPKGDMWEKNADGKLEKYADKDEDRTIVGTLPSGLLLFTTPRVPGMLLENPTNAPLTHKVGGTEITLSAGDIRPMPKPPTAFDWVDTRIKSESNERARVADFERSNATFVHRLYLRAQGRLKPTGKPKEYKYIEGGNERFVTWGDDYEKLETEYDNVKKDYRKAVEARIEAEAARDKLIK